MAGVLFVIGVNGTLLIPNDPMYNTVAGEGSKGRLTDTHLELLPKEDRVVVGGKVQFNKAAIFPRYPMATPSRHSKNPRARHVSRTKPAKAHLLRWQLFSEFFMQLDSEYCQATLMLLSFGYYRQDDLGLFLKANYPDSADLFSSEKVLYVSCDPASNQSMLRAAEAIELKKSKDGKAAHDAIKYRVAKNYMASQKHRNLQHAFFLDDQPIPALSGHKGVKYCSALESNAVIDRFLKKGIKAAAKEGSDRIELSRRGVFISGPSATV